MNKHGLRHSAGQHTKLEGKFPGELSVGNVQGGLSRKKYPGESQVRTVWGEMSWECPGQFFQ